MKYGKSRIRLAARVQPSRPRAKRQLRSGFGELRYQDAATYLSAFVQR